MTSFISFWIGQRCEKIGVWRDTLSRYKELIHGHRGVKSYSHAWEVLYVPFFDWIRSVWTEQVHQFVNAHWRNYLYYNKINTISKNSKLTQTIKDYMFSYSYFFNIVKSQRIVIILNARGNSCRSCSIITEAKLIVKQIYRTNTIIG